jgi:NAD(P)-dependent dehydrogenase (short-subunit alcohol dehydrogenase family)
MILSVKYAVSAMRRAGGGSIIITSSVAGLRGIGRISRSPMRIGIETIEHSKQRYPTVGDWQGKPDGLHVYVSKMSDQRYEFLIGMHGRSRLTSRSVAASHPLQ